MLPYILHMYMYMLISSRFRCCAKSMTSSGFQVIQESLLADGGFAYVPGSPAPDPWSVHGLGYGGWTHP